VRTASRGFEISVVGSEFGRELWYQARVMSDEENAESNAEQSPSATEDLTAEEPAMENEDSEEVKAPAEDDSEKPEPSDSADNFEGWLNGKHLSAKLHFYLGFVAPAVLSAITMWRLRAHTVDDAYISFRYARNFARGLGLVYNPGEKIEGYTNFLWTLILSLFVKVGADPNLVAKVLGSGCAFGSVYVVYKLAERQHSYTWLPCLATWLLASTTPFMGYSIFGLETPLFSLLTLAGTLQIFREEETTAPIFSRQGFPWSGLLFAAAGLTRPEAPMYLGIPMLFLAGKALVPFKGLEGDEQQKRAVPFFAAMTTLLVALAVHLLVQRPTDLTRYGSLVVAAAAGLATLCLLPRTLFGLRNLVRGMLFVLPVVTHLAWRKSYYGKYLPNTLTAKTGDLRQQVAGGLRYVENFLVHEGPILTLAVFGIVAGILWKKRELLTFAMIGLCGLFYITLVGGDWMPIFRFAGPIQPWLYLLIGIALRALLEQGKPLLRGGMLVLLIAAAGYRGNRLESSRSYLLHREKRFWDTAAGGVVRWFKEQEQSRGRQKVYGTIAMGDIGEVGWGTDYPILDLLGLVDPVISELPGGYTLKIGPGYRNRFFDVQPRYFVLISAKNSCRHPSVPGSRSLYQDRRFNKDYQVSGRVRLDDGFFWCIYENRAKRDPQHKVVTVDNRPKRLGRR
jgi:arabinofuranosyltransferase